MTREITSKVPTEIEEPAATVGPWESASQVARSVLHPPEPTFTCSKFFPLPALEKSGSAEHVIHLVSPEKPKDIGEGLPSSPNLDESLVDRSASPDYREGQLPRAAILSALANASPVNDTAALPEARSSEFQTSSSLDSVDRALLHLGAPEIVNLPYLPSLIRKRSFAQQESNAIPEDMELYQYGLELTGNNCEVPLPLLHLDDREDIEGRPQRNSDTPGTPGNTQHRPLDFQGEYHLGEYGKDVFQRFEGYSSTMYNSPEFANDIAYTSPNSPYGCQNEETFNSTNEGDASHEMAMDSMSVASAELSAQPEDDEDTKTNIHLWDGVVWPRAEMTNVQRVEQDVAKTLRGHWFPYKF